MQLQLQGCKELIPGPKSYKANLAEKLSKLNLRFFVQGTNSWTS